MLSIFLGTIAYLLAVLQTISAETNAYDIPRFAVSGAVVRTLDPELAP